MMLDWSVDCGMSSCGLFVDCGVFQAVLGCVSWRLRVVYLGDWLGEGEGEGESSFGVCYLKQLLIFLSPCVSIEK